MINQPDRWVVPVGDGTVIQLRLDYAFTLVVETGFELRIESDFTFADDNGGHTYEPDEHAALGPVLTLHQAVVSSAEVLKDGHLIVLFADGRSLRVPPDDEFEAFNVAGPNQQLLVALPGGGTG